MIGLALVVFVTIFANGLRASISDLIDRTLAGDIAVLHDDGFTPDPGRGRADGGQGRRASPPCPRSATPRRSIKGVGGTQLTHAIEPATVGQVYNFDWKDGSQKSLDELGNDGVLLEENVADGRRLQGRRQASPSPARAAT